MKSTKDYIPRFERRKFRRVHIPIHLRYFSSTQAEITPSVTENISVGGLRLYLNSRPKKDEKLSLDLMIAKKHSIIHCHGRLVWIKSLPQGSQDKYNAGIKFIDISKKDRKILLKSLEGKKQKKVQKKQKK